jgi:hypothetical protein
VKTNRSSPFWQSHRRSTSPTVFKWKTAKGAWEKTEGGVRGSEKPEDKHCAVTRLPSKIEDFVLEYEFKV